MQKLEGLMGESIYSFATKMVEASKRASIQSGSYLEVEGDFNGIILKTNQNFSSKKIVEDYFKQLDKRKIERMHSEAYKELKKKEAAEILALSNQAEDLIKRLSVIDLADHNEVLQWLCELQPISNNIDINFDRKLVIEKFESHGYQIGVNTDENFHENEKENVAEYIIGQALSGLNAMGAIHPMIISFASEWKTKFQSV